MSDIPTGSESQICSAPAREPHRTLHVQHGDMEADIDEEIAPLVLEMWKAGIDTFMSCQSNPSGWVWIQFSEQWAATKFLNIVGVDDGNVDSIHDRILHGYRSKGWESGDWQSSEWRYQVVVDDWSMEEIEVEDGVFVDVCMGPPDFVILFCIHFPVADLATVHGLLQAHNLSRVEACQPG